MCRSTTHDLYRSHLRQQDHCKSHRWIATNNRDVPRVMKTKFLATVMVFWCDFNWGPHHATSHLQSRLESQHQSVPGWMWWSPGAIRWPVADPGCSSRIRSRLTSPKRPRLGFKGSATTLYPSLTDPLLLQHEPAGLLRLVTRREHHPYDLPQHQSQPDHRHPPSIRRALTGACGKGMLPVPDLYRDGNWGWRRLHKIDVSSTT